MHNFVLSLARQSNKTPASASVLNEDGTGIQELARHVTQVDTEVPEFQNSSTLDRAMYETTLGLGTPGREVHAPKSSSVAPDTKISELAPNIKMYENELGLAKPVTKVLEFASSLVPTDTAIQPEQAAYIPLTLPEILSPSTSDASVSALRRFEDKLTSAYETTRTQSSFDEFNSYLSLFESVEKKMGFKSHGERSCSDALQKVHDGGILKKHKSKRKLEEVFTVPNLDQLRALGCGGETGDFTGTLCGRGYTTPTEDEDRRQFLPNGKDLIVLEVFSISCERWA